MRQILIGFIWGISLGVIFLFAVVALAGETAITGQVSHVRDGDTIVVAGVPVRLNGVNAPENRTAIGQRATDWMRDNYLHQPMVCILSGERTYDRMVGVCIDEQGRNIGAEIIRAGLARDCPRYSGGFYRDLETAWARENISQPSYCNPR